MFFTYCLLPALECLDVLVHQMSAIASGEVLSALQHN